MASIEPEGPVVEVGGVGMLLRVSGQTAQSLPAPGGEVRLLAHLVVREDALDLYGFATAAARGQFAAFLSVGGVGPRMALALCGVAAPDELRLAIARGDGARLQAAPGVGKRTAEGAALAPAGSADAYLAARDGLLGLGFKVEEADAALAEAPPGLEAEALVRHGLERLRRR